jgi:hypothetical protein
MLTLLARMSRGDTDGGNAPCGGAANGGLGRRFGARLPQLVELVLSQLS